MVRGEKLLSDNVHSRISMVIRTKCYKPILSEENKGDKETLERVTHCVLQSARNFSVTSGLSVCPARYGYGQPGKLVASSSPAWIGAMVFAKISHCTKPNGAVSLKEG